MPDEYEGIKRSLLRKRSPITGKPLYTEKEAEGSAARIFNANRPKGAVPMGPNYEQRAAAARRKGRK